MTARSSFLTTLVCAFLPMSLAMAQSNDPAWLDDVATQMLDGEGCIVDLFINIDEGVLGSGNYYEARVQCRDGRLFDVSRVDPETKFTIKMCQNVVC